MKKILITNDDGIFSDGLIRLVRAAAAHGEVWIVAPDAQRSAASHSITLHQHIDVIPYDFPVEGVHAFSCTAQPADCIRVGVLSIMPEKPDVVLSGINFGYNVAGDIQYSATAGAAFEAVYQGCAAIAFSEGFACHETTDAYLEQILAELIDRPYERGKIWNVNFPDCPLKDCKGILRERRVSGAGYFRDGYKLQEKLPGGGVRLMVQGSRGEAPEPGTDYEAIESGYVSVGQARNIS